MLLRRQTYGFGKQKHSYHMANGKQLPDEP